MHHLEALLTKHNKQQYDIFILSIQFMQLNTPKSAPANELMQLNRYIYYKSYYGFYFKSISMSKYITWLVPCPPSSSRLAERLLRKEAASPVFIAHHPTSVGKRMPSFFWLTLISWIMHHAIRPTDKHANWCPFYHHHYYYFNLCCALSNIKLT